MPTGDKEKHAQGMQDVEMEDIVEKGNLAIHTDDTCDFILCGFEKCKEDQCRPDRDAHKQQGRRVFVNVEKWEDSRCGIVLQRPWKRISIHIDVAKKDEKQDQASAGVEQ